jgi:hypothetical protein
VANYSVAGITNMTGGEKDKLINPVQEYVWVHTSDVGADYVTGSEGQIKIIREYADLGKTKLISTQTFYYRDLTYPTKPTERVVV